MLESVLNAWQMTQGLINSNAIIMSTIYKGWWLWLADNDRPLITSYVADNTEGEEEWLSRHEMPLSMYIVCMLSRLVERTTGSERMILNVQPH